MIGTGLSPEWDRWFDEQFTDLMVSDEELLHTEFDGLVSACWPPPPSPPGAGPGGSIPPPDGTAPPPQA